MDALSAEQFMLFVLIIPAWFSFLFGAVIGLLTL